MIIITHTFGLKEKKYIKGTNETNKKKRESIRFSFYKY